MFVFDFDGYMGPAPKIIAIFHRLDLAVAAGHDSLVRDSWPGLTG